MSYFGYTNYGEQRLIINGTYISGIQTIDTSTNFNRDPIYIAGIGVLKSQINKQIIPSFSFEQIITNRDVVPNFVTGNATLNGLFQHGDNFLSFSSGFISNYSLSCRIGELVRSNTTINCYGLYEYTSNTGQFSPFLNNTHSGLKIPDYSSISIGLNDALVDRVIAFNLDVELENEPIYKIGSVPASQAKLKLPVKVSMSFELEIDQSQLKEVTQNLCNDYSEDISIFVNAKCTEENLFSFVMDGAELKAQRYNGRIGSNALVTFEYVKYYNSLPLFISDSGVLVNPIGRYVLLEREYGNFLAPSDIDIKRINSYTLTGNLNF